MLGNVGAVVTPQAVPWAGSPGRGGTGRRKVGTARNVALGLGLGLFAPLSTSPRGTASPARPGAGMDLLSSGEDETLGV